MLGRAYGFVVDPATRGMSFECANSRCFELLLALTRFAATRCLWPSGWVAQNAALGAGAAKAIAARHATAAGSCDRQEEANTAGVGDGLSDTITNLSVADGTVFITANITKSITLVAEQNMLLPAMADGYT